MAAPLRRDDVVPRERPAGGNESKSQPTPPRVGVSNVRALRARADERNAVNDSGAGERQRKQREGAPGERRLGDLRGARRKIEIRREGAPRGGEPGERRCPDEDPSEQQRRRGRYSMLMVRRLDFSTLGSVSSITPSFIAAFAFESSTFAGRSSVRVNAPCEISQR